MTQEIFLLEGWPKLFLQLPFAPQLAMNIGRGSPQLLLTSTQMLTVPINQETGSLSVTYQTQEMLTMLSYLDLEANIDSILEHLQIMSSALQENEKELFLQRNLVARVGGMQLLGDAMEVSEKAPTETSTNETLVRVVNLNKASYHEIAP